MSDIFVRTISLGKNTYLVNFSIIDTHSIKAEILIEKDQTLSSSEAIIVASKVFQRHAAIEGVSDTNEHREAFIQRAFNEAFLWVDTCLADRDEMYELAEAMNKALEEMDLRDIRID